MMGEGHKRRSIDEMIEHMNADFQSSDGQYIQLGFTPPPNSVSPHRWSETFVPAQTSAPQIHPYQSNHVHPVFLRDAPIQFKTHQNLLPTIPHNVEVPPSFFHVQPSPPATSESMTCENHAAGLPYVNPGQPPRTLGGFVPYQTIPDHPEQPPPRNYNLFGEGHVRLIRVADENPNAEHWGSSSKSDPGLMIGEKGLRGKMVNLPSDSSPRQTELIDNLVGQWVPTPSGTYNPFGNQAGSGRNQNVNSPKELSTPVKIENKGGNGFTPAEKTKRRGAAETKVARPSYSDVLSKTPPNKTHSSPSLVNKSSSGGTGTTSDGKGKGSSGGLLRSKNGGGRKGGLKRQYSSGSDEQVVSNVGPKLHLTPDGGVGLLGNKCGGHGEINKRQGEPISRRWVSLDDLDCGGEGEAEDVDGNENTDKDQRDVKVGELVDMEIKFTLAENINAECERVKKATKGIHRGKTGGLNQACAEETVDSLLSSNAISSGSTPLNNYKAASAGSIGGKAQGASGAKRPLHINNNLGTPSFWASSGQLGGEKNVVKGSNGNNSSGNIANSKNCKACSEERKATSASSGSGNTKGLAGESGKTGGSGSVSARGRGGGSVCPGGGGQGAPQPPPPPPERTSREPQLGKRGQRNRRREGQQPFVTLCRTARQHVIRWGTIILQALLWFLHLLSDILSLSSHLIWNMCSTLWEWLGVSSRKLACAFQDRFSPWVSANSKGGINKKRTSSVGSSVPKWWICSWFQWGWKGSVKWCRKSVWKFRHWLGRRGWWGGISGENQDWENDDGDEREGGVFGGGRDKGGGSRKGRFGFHHPGSLECNISLPSTGEEAMKRLLACKGKDPYSILGVTPNCSDDDVKKYYKRQAFLVHPDKNGQPGAEEAFKILVHAFDLIGEPEKRQAYDRRVVETQQAEHAWSEFSDLLSQLQEKMAEAANTIRCTNCGKRHRRISVPRPCYAARLCSQCKIHHAAREGDIWAESSMLGFLWHYYACMEGAIYDITEWAACQGDNLRHLRPNSHNVQYRILLGKRSGGSSSGGGSPMSPGGIHSHSGSNSKSSRSSESPNEPDLDHFLNNLYSGGGGVGGNADNSQRQEQTRKRKGKRKK